ncbi:MAG: amino acid permease [Myxococcales bacterium]|nr:amino acid permease [Myxococcales bacterium]NNK07307.1 amino acid permease [Myxococcales bacterium]NNK41676.1 amino acid permease [Myxococcales bacterium]
MNDSQPAQLRRSLGFWALVFYGVGDILGAGIYALVGKVAGVAGSASWAAFGVALVVAGLTALTYAELGGRFPRSAGESFFTGQAFGRPGLSLLVGWMVLSSGILSLATVSVAFGGYMSGLVPGLSPSATVVGILLLLAAINFRGMRESSTTNIIATMVELTGLLIVIVVGALFLERSPDAGILQTIEAGRAASWTEITSGAALGFFAFIGFEDMVNVAEEVKDPERNMPRAILAALCVTGIIYLLVVLVATSVVPPAELGVSDAPLLSVVQRATEVVPDRLFTLIALFAVANTGLLNFIMASRLIYGMSRQGLLPTALGAVHPRRRTPHLAVVTVLAVALALALSGTLTFLAGTTSLLLLLVFFTVNVSLMVIKRRESPSPRTFCAPRWVPLVGAISCLGLMPFVPRSSLLTAGIIVALGACLVLLHGARSRA